MAYSYFLFLFDVVYLIKYLITPIDYYFNICDGFRYIFIFLTIIIIRFTESKKGLLLYFKEVYPCLLSFISKNYIIKNGIVNLEFNVIKYSILNNIKIILLKNFNS